MLMCVVKHCSLARFATQWTLKLRNIMFRPRKELGKRLDRVSSSRVSSRKVLILLVTAIATGLFAACSNTNSNTGSNDQKLSMPAIDSTKVTPTPAIANTSTVAPTTTQSTASQSTSPKAPEPNATNLSPTPSPTVAFKNLPELKIGELETYKRGGLLEIDVPKGWKLADNSQPSEILVTWVETAERATVSVNIFVPPSEIPENRLGDVFETIIKGMYGHQSDFSMRSPVLEATGNIAIEWTSTVTIGDKRIKFQANSRLQRINNKFAILTVGAIEPKFTEMQDAFARIANSQIVNPTLAIP